MSKIEFWTSRILSQYFATTEELDACFYGIPVNQEPIHPRLLTQHIFRNRHRGEILLICGMWYKLSVPSGEIEKLSHCATVMSTFFEMPVFLSIRSCLLPLRQVYLLCDNRAGPSILLTMPEIVLSSPYLL